MRQWEQNLKLNFRSKQTLSIYKRPLSEKWIESVCVSVRRWKLSPKVVTMRGHVQSVRLSSIFIRKFAHHFPISIKPIYIKLTLSWQKNVKPRSCFECTHTRMYAYTQTIHRYILSCYMCDTQAAYYVVNRISIGILCHHLWRAESVSLFFNRRSENFTIALSFAAVSALQHSCCTLHSTKRRECLVATHRQPHVIRCRLGLRLNLKNLSIALLCNTRLVSRVWRIKAKCENERTLKRGSNLTSSGMQRFVWRFV